MWNGDLPQAKQILATGFTVNAALVGVDGAAVQGAPGVADWVALLRKALGEPVFTVEVGLIIDGNPALRPLAPPRPVPRRNARRNCRPG